MASATLTSKGQITVPAEIRKLLNLKAGDRIEFIHLGNHDVRIYAKNQSVKRLKGMFGKFPRTVSIEEMNEVIARGGAGLPEEGVETY
jgi:antitoxin PrlF